MTLTMSYSLFPLLFLCGSLLVVCRANVVEELIGGGTEAGAGGDAPGGFSLSNVLGGATKSKGAEAPAAAAENAVGAVSALSALTKPAEKEAGAKESGGFLGISSYKDLLKLVVNPVEFIRSVAKHFKLHFGKFFELVNKGLSFGLELALQPVLVTLKIIEKIFVPDACKLKLICKITAPLSFAKGHLPHLSSKFLEGSHIIKALSDGLHANDCETTYSGCSGSPQLKREYQAAALGGDKHEAGHHEHGGHQHGGGHQHHHHNGGEQQPGFEASTNLFKALKSVG